MIIQTFKTSCDNCGGDAVMTTADMTDENEILLEFLDGEDLTCTDCGATTIISIDKNCEG